MIDENSTIELTKSSGNVFADMDLNNAEEFLIRAKVRVYCTTNFRKSELKVTRNSQYT